MRTIRIAALIAALSAVPAQGQSAPEAARLEVRFRTDQPEAVLAILARRREGEPVTDAHWRTLFGSEGYRRLKERQAAMGRPLEDSTFRRFVLSDSLLAREAELRTTLEAWRRMDPGAAARSAFAYLPAGARIRATVYPSIKPQDNSFVYDLAGENPAIFLYLDPEVSAAELQNTVAHELHHVGYGAGCRDDSAVAEPVRLARLWMGAFGEGVAMLAAAGGPGVHPHAASPAAERERWDRDVARFDADLAELERFLLDVVEGRLTGDAVTEKARSFYGIQGPWYTVGWTMAATIERVHGRDALVAALCDPRSLLAAYNAAATAEARRGGARRATWSPVLLERLGARR